MHSTSGVAPSFSVPQVLAEMDGGLGLLRVRAYVFVGNPRPWCCHHAQKRKNSAWNPSKDSRYAILWPSNAVYIPPLSKTRHSGVVSLLKQAAWVLQNYSNTSSPRKYSGPSCPGCACTCPLWCPLCHPQDSALAKANSPWRSTTTHILSKL